MRLDLDDVNFRSTLSSWLRGLSDDVIVDLRVVFDQAPGVYPTTLLELWREELKQRHLTARSPTSPVLTGNSYDNDLPVSHPVDSDWRFTPESTIQLVQIALESASAGEPVVHLGTPSTFLRCILSDSQHQHVLLDRNVAVLDALAARSICAPHIMLGVDLQAVGRLHLNAAAAIVDPPWYLDDTLLFLGAAAEACRHNATIMLCQPATGTRPGVEQERAVLLDRVSALGLTLYALRSGAVRYVTPHFERASLRATAGGVAIPTDWRRGDLLLLKRLSNLHPSFRPSVADPHWREVDFGPVRIKIARHPTGTDLGTLVPGDVLTTVSRRDSIRKRIGLWTSGNLAFTVANPLAVGKLIVLCETDLMKNILSLPNTLRHADDVGLDRDAAKQLYTVLLAELTEHYQYGGKRNA